jgi:hypothetical protein
MGLKQVILAVKAKFAEFLRARKIRSAMFSGTPMITKVSVIESGTNPTWSLVFKNGLMLTLGEAGILDYQDRDFGSFMGGPGNSTAPDNREFLVHMHKIILKSLLKYVIHPGLDPLQRERAAEAASKLWLATESGQFTVVPPDGTVSGSWLTGLQPASGKNPHPLR